MKTRSSRWAVSEAGGLEPTCMLEAGLSLSHMPYKYSASFHSLAPNSRMEIHVLRFGCCYMDGSSRIASGARTANILRILVVDDNRAEAVLLIEVMKNLRRRHELHFVWDGMEALDFLHGRGAFAEAPRPNLILLDLNLPRLGGLETLSAIKSDPELYAIPVIVFSSSDLPGDVRRSYQAHANC